MRRPACQERDGLPELRKMHRIWETANSRVRRRRWQDYLLRFHSGPDRVALHTGKPRFRTKPMLLRLCDSVHSAAAQALAELPTAVHVRLTGTNGSRSFTSIAND